MQQELPIIMFKPASFRLLMLALLVPLLLLNGCGFTPVYGNKESSPQLSTVSIDNIGNREGQQLRLLLSDRFYSAQGQSAQPQWALKVTLTTGTEKLGIRRDDVATRARLNVSAVFELRKVGEATPIYKGVERSFVSYNILTDPYATTVAEDNALLRGQTQIADLIATRIALFLKGQAGQ
jgi:LPS-assembly lipoprotein